MSGSRLFFMTVWARAYPRVIGSMRHLSWLIMEVGLPLLGTVAMVLVYRGLHAPRQYLGFVILGGAMLAFWQNVLWSMAAQFYWDSREGSNLELFVISPTSLAAVLMGMAVGGIYMTASRAVVVVVAGSLVFGVTYDLSGLLPALGVFLLSLAALYCLGMLLASLFLFYGREAWHLNRALEEPIYFVSGFYFPVHALGAYLGGAASLLPLTLGLDAIRQLLLPSTPRFIAPGWEVLALAAQLVAYAILAQMALQYMERRGRAEGRLIIHGA